MKRIAKPAEQLPASGERRKLKVAGKALALIDVASQAFLLFPDSPAQEPAR